MWHALEPRALAPGRQMQGFRPLGDSPSDQTANSTWLLS